jgi:hypothetical protein
MHITISILDGISTVLVNLAAHAELTGELMKLSPRARSGIRVELEQISSEIKSHMSTARSLLNISDDIRFMVSEEFYICNLLILSCILTEP